MTLLASYPDPADAALAMDALRRGTIAYETRVGEENGLEFTEIHVAAEVFDRACDVIERHDAELMEARKEEHGRRSGCPTCGAPNLKLREDIDCSGSITGIAHIMECGKCGRLVPR